LIYSIKYIFNTIKAKNMKTKENIIIDFVRLLILYRNLRLIPTTFDQNQNDKKLF
jgi:hypothetical protein